MLSRSHVVTQFLRLFAEPAYLEVGVNLGETFHGVQASRKVAVDPRFAFDVAAHQVEGEVEFYRTTSDAFFAEFAGELGTYDVIYLDGLHTFEQTLRDFLNAMEFLNRRGVIVIDDVLPDSYDSSLPDFAQVAHLRHTAAQSGASWPFNGSWMGDVFKLPFFIESFVPQVSFATVLENHGQTVVWREARPVAAIPQRSLEAIARLDYRDTILSRDVFRICPLDDIVAKVRRALLSDEDRSPAPASGMDGTSWRIPIPG
jgi:hypothetical protein